MINLYLENILQNRQYFLHHRKANSLWINNKDYNIKSSKEIKKTSSNI